MRALAIVLPLVLLLSANAELIVQQRDLLFLAGDSPGLQDLRSLFNSYDPSVSSPPPQLQRPSIPEPPSNPEIPQGSGKMVVAPRPTGVSVARLNGFVLVIVLANRDGMCFIRNFGSIDSSVKVMGTGTSASVSGELSAVGECEDGAVGFGIAYIQANVLAQAQRNGDDCRASVSSSGSSGSSIFGSGISVGTTGTAGGSAGCDSDKLEQGSPPSSVSVPRPSPPSPSPSPPSPSPSPPPSPSSKKGKKKKSKFSKIFSRRG